LIHFYKRKLTMELHVRRMKPQPKKINPLNKKVKPNPKYNTVEPTVNTGNNLRKELERIEEIQQYYKFRPDEIFRRININSLVSLVIEVNKLEHQLDENHAATDPHINDLNAEDDLDIQSELDDSASIEVDIPDCETVVDEDIKSIIHNVDNDDPRRSHASGSRVGTGRSLTRLAMGVGELDNQNQTNKPPSTPNRPFLILDVREEDLYERKHIAMAKSYHHFRLSRAFNYETKEMLMFKNKEKRVIVVYDDDETVASKVATTLTQRGYDNVFLLSGGLTVAAIKYPSSLLTDGGESGGLEEGDIMVLENLLEENIARGSSRMSTAGSRVSSVRSTRGMGSCREGVSRGMGARDLKFDAPIRTSTAMGRR